MIKDFSGKEGYVNEIFMVKDVAEGVGTNGSHYLSLKLQDMSGTIAAKKWNLEEGDKEIATIGSLIRVEGNSLLYKNQPQLKINEFYPVSVNDVDISKYIPVAPVSIDAMKKKLDEFISMIEDEQLHDLTAALIKENYDSYTSYPAAVTVHHAYCGGLMYHSLSICAMAIKVQQQYSYLSKDYLIAGSLLHDIGKTKEFSSYLTPKYTVEGNLLGHISLGATMVFEEGIKLDVDREKLNVLVHMVLSHHGKFEFGSPKVPATPEAYVLHSLDDLDAKLECLRETYGKLGEGEFSGNIPWIENANFYKPKKLN